MTKSKFPRRLESTFDAAFATKLALKEKQIQQSYRPVIGIHKWFARRPGTIFRSLLLSEFSDKPVSESFWTSHEFRGTIADPFMGGGTPIFEANRLGFDVVGCDVNPMAFWLVRQSLLSQDIDALRSVAKLVIDDVEKKIGDLYHTKCLKCSGTAEVKYFIWVKTAPCPSCDTVNDLFPGYLLAEAERHPANVIVCPACGDLNECIHLPSKEAPASCTGCKAHISVEGPAKRQHVPCRKCGTRYPYLTKSPEKPLDHRVFAMEYHCASCKPTHEGRFFKKPDNADMRRLRNAGALFSELGATLPIPQDAIPSGDETDRLHRWGYRFYREMFTERQKLGLGLLLKRIMTVAEDAPRHALLTVFSDFLRYQNLLCRYDTYALKCQDIFSVHGFPVGLVQCENNLLGIAGVGSGSFRHFVEKFIRAKEYCQAPFETRQEGKRKIVVPIKGERIEARLVEKAPQGGKREAYILAVPAWEMKLAKNSLDGVFTDPPYFDNVQYAELMDFCFVWLRLGAKIDFPQFNKPSTRNPHELTGNDTLGRGLEHFASGISDVFRHYARALKPNAPFVFTYHHNDPKAYLPLVLAILDAGLDCTATLPAAAEMNASLHIAGTGSSVLDSVFVCRSVQGEIVVPRGQSVCGVIIAALEKDALAMREAGLQISRGDLRCLAVGHIARLAINSLAKGWNVDSDLVVRLAKAREQLQALSVQVDVAVLVNKFLSAAEPVPAVMA